MKLLAPPRFYREIWHWSAVDLMSIGAVTSIVGGLLWALSGTLSVLLVSGTLSATSGFEAVTEILYIVAMVGTLDGIVALHARQSPYYGLCGSLGFLGACTGSVILLLGVPVSSVLGTSAPGELDLVLGAAFWTVSCGLLLLGVATLKLGFLPSGPV